MMIRTLAPLFLAVALAAPAAAQPAPAETVAADPASIDPAPLDPAPLDPARVAVAKRTVDYLFPLGTYERMMKGTMDQVMNTMMAEMGNMPASDLTAMMGMDDADVPEEERGKTLAEIARAEDPDYDERRRISTTVMMDEMVALMTTMEPAVRDALTQIYARRYTVPQLREMNAFFRSDTGGAFARDYMTVFTDPEMMQSMLGMVPEMMQAMPKIIEKVEAATAHLPKVASSYDDLGLDTDCDPSTEGGCVVATTDHDQPWFHEESWSPADRARVAKLTDRYIDAVTEQEQAVAQAQANARKRLEESE